LDDALLNFGAGTLGQRLQLFERFFDREGNPVRRTFPRTRLQIEPD
jgi:hypothetical protein